MQDIGIDELLRGEYGLRDDAVRIVRAAMEAQSITRPGKTRIALSKRNAISRMIGARFLRTCHRVECRAKAEHPSKQRLDVAPEHCEVCGGSAADLAGANLREAMRRAGKCRLLVIGGTPNTQAEVLKQLGDAGEVRFVSNGEAHSSRTASENKGWADVIVIWATTPIDHKITTHYRGPRTITVAQRGAAALASGVASHLFR